MTIKDGNILLGWDKLISYILKVKYADYTCTLHPTAYPSSEYFGSINQKIREDTFWVQ